MCLEPLCALCIILNENVAVNLLVFFRQTHISSVEVFVDLHSPLARHIMEEKQTAIHIIRCKVIACLTPKDVDASDH